MVPGRPTAQIKIVLDTIVVDCQESGNRVFLNVLSLVPIARKQVYCILGNVY